MTISIPRGSACVASTAAVCAKDQAADGEPIDRTACRRCINVIASAAAVASSSIEAPGNIHACQIGNHGLQVQSNASSRPG